VRADSSIQRVEELRGLRIGVGAHDSPQATLIPLHHLERAGLRPGDDCEVVPFDVLVGKHGDHIGGERDAANALKAGDVDAACLIDSNLLAFALEGTLPSGTVRVLTRTPTFDHCNFTVLDDAPSDQVQRFRTLLLGMSYADPVVRPLLDLEGLKEWKPGRTEGYQQLAGAIESFGTIDNFAQELSTRCA
jgi:ABC-type phosphate/phosphonate transport system substrate-binding protein